MIQNTRGKFYMSNQLHSKHSWAVLIVLIMVALVAGGCATVKQITDRAAPGAAQAAAPTASVPNPTPTPIVVSTPSVKTADKATDKLLGGANLTYNGEIIADRIIPVVA